MFEQEPPSQNNKLFSLDNIILTHNSALTLECRKRMSLESCMNVFNYLKNKKYEQKVIL